MMYWRLSQKGGIYMEKRTIQQYYSSIRHLFDVYDREARQYPAPCEDLVSLREWQTEARKKFHSILGIDRMEGCQLYPERLDDGWEEKDYIAERVKIHTAKELTIPLTILIPKNMKRGEKRPVWLHAFGHGSSNYMADSFRSEPRGPKSPFTKPYIGAGALKDLAKEGYIGIAFDSVGSGERMSYPWLSGEVMDIGADNPLNTVLTSLGISKVGLEVWDLMRVTDYALSRSDCDGRIGVMGTSGGGHQSLFFAAADERVQAAASSVWFYGFRDAHIGLPHNCSCNYPIGLMKAFDCCDIGSLIAPRALHIETGWRDYLSSRELGIGNVLSQYYKTQASYRLYDKTERLSLYVFDGGHGCKPWNNEMTGVPQSGGGLLEFVYSQMPLRIENESQEKTKKEGGKADFSRNESLAMQI